MILFDRIKGRLVAILLGVLIGLLPMVEKPESVFSYMEAAFIVVIVCSAILVFNNRWHGNVRVQISDILVFVYLAYGFINLAVFRGLHHVDTYLWWKWCALALAYIVMRTVRYRESVLVVLLLAGVWQSIVAIAQRTGLVESKNIIFDITGTFRNPGLLGGFLAVCMLVALGMVFKYSGKAEDSDIQYGQRRLKLWLCVSVTLIIAAGLFLSDSRASWLAVLVGVAVYCWPRVEEIARRHKVLSAIVLASLMAVIMVALFQYRVGSANSRLLIWRVCADMIAQKPIFGSGVASFYEQYMLYQGNYFAAHPDSRFLMVADNVFYPYNEWLHIFIEQGIIGLTIVITLFYTLFSFRSRNKTYRIFKGALSGLIVFSMFSYPSYVFPILSLFAILTGGLKSKECFAFNYNSFGSIAFKLVLIAISTLALFQLRYYRNGSELMDTLFVPNSKPVQEFVEKNYDMLQYNNVFNYAYSEWLRSNVYSQTDPKYIDGIFPYCEGYCTKGDYCMKIGDYASAESFYKEASDMIPTRLLPNYRLWQLYLQQGDTIAARDIGIKAMTQPLKLENDFTKYAKIDIVRFLKGLK